MSIQPNKSYVSRCGDVVKVSENTDGWLDGLPFVCEVVSWGTIAGGLGLGGAPKYTVNEEGLVYPTCEQPKGWCSQDLIREAQ